MLSVVHQLNYHILNELDLGCKFSLVGVGTRCLHVDRFPQHLGQDGFCFDNVAGMRMLVVLVLRQRSQHAEQLSVFIHLMLLLLAGSRRSRHG